MSFGAAASAITSLKNNNRRKNSHIPFDENKTSHKHGKPINSKELTPEEKIKLLAQLKENRKREEKLKAYKMIISLGVTVVVIGIIVFTLKAVYF